MPETKSHKVEFFKESLQLTFAPIMGAFTAKLLEPYWSLSDCRLKLLILTWKAKKQP